jgi:peptidoglycan/LPS O-acetylase OafA/YrhL
LPGSWDVLWSLSIEEAFYLFFPLVCIALRSEARMLVPILALIAIGPISRVYGAGTEPWDEYAYLSCTDGIAFGCLAALFHVRITPSRQWLRVAMAVGVAATLLIVVFRHATNALGLVSTGLYITLLEAGAALVLLALAGGVGERSLARLGVVAFVGRSSYEIYLTHMFVVFATVAIFRAAGADLAYIGLWYAGALAASVLLGYLVSACYSAPANRLIRAAAIRPVAAASTA